MKKILVCCNLSVTSSLLVEKIRSIIRDRGLDVEIDSAPVKSAIDHLGAADVIMLGPMVGYAKAGFEEAGARKVVVISADDYQAQSAARILDEGLEALAG